MPFGIPPEHLPLPPLPLTRCVGEFTSPGVPLPHHGGGGEPPLNTAGVRKVAKLHQTYKGRNFLQSHGWTICQEPQQEPQGRKGEISAQYTRQASLPYRKICANSILFGTRNSRCICRSTRRKGQYTVHQPCSVRQGLTVSLCPCGFWADKGHAPRGGQPSARAYHMDYSL